MARPTPDEPQTEQEYHAALKSVRRHFESEPDEATSEASDFDMLAQLIKRYEIRHHKIG